MKINFKKLSDTAIMPRKANYNDAGNEKREGN